MQSHLLQVLHPPRVQPRGWLTRPRTRPQRPSLYRCIATPRRGASSSAAYGAPESPPCERPCSPGDVRERWRRLHARQGAEAERATTREAGRRSRA
eukprot:scaffold301977_cov35-Tisochrysis_lutea.AAC.2